MDVLRRTLMHRVVSYKLDPSSVNITVYPKVSKTKELTTEIINEDKIEVDFLKREYDDWTARHECKTKTQEEIFKDICFNRLQNWKALVSTTLYDGMYYEITLNGDKNEIYVDCYKKWENYVVKVED